MVHRETTNAGKPVECRAFIVCQGVGIVEETLLVKSIATPNLIDAEPQLLGSIDRRFGINYQ